MQQACKDCESSSQTTEPDKQLNLQIFENIKRENKHMTQDDIELIKNSFKQYSYFFQLQDSQVDQIIKNMFYSTQIGEEYIYKNDDQASLIFVIEKGQVQMKFNDKDQNVRIRKEGDFFGELYLYPDNNNFTRNTSIKTISECSFWCIDIQTYKKLVRQSSQKEYDENRSLIDQVQFFQAFTSEERDLIAHELKQLTFSPESVLVNEGDQADSYYIIFSGQVSFWRNNLEIRKMYAKDGFGEQALYSKSTSDATVKADSEVICLCLKRHQIMRLFGDQVQMIIFRNIMRQSIEQSPVLINLTKLQIEQVVFNAQISNYKNGQVIIEGNKPCDKLIVVLEGSIINEKQYNIAKGQCFGDYYLSEANRKQIIETDYVMVGDGILASIPYSLIEQITSENLQKELINQNDHYQQIQQIQQLADKSYASDINLEDLIFIKKLPSEMNYELTNQQFELKFWSLESQMKRHLLQEKAVLEAVNFPFIIQLVRTFKDEISFYFLFEFVNGMELFDVIREIGLLDKYGTQFYVASMILCLEYLHSRNIIHRGLKPENIMINGQGYMNLWDLFTVKILTKKQRYRTYTIIGTPHYMAPEIIMGKGYTYSVDLWSVGICMYEFCGGNLPYAEDAEDPYEIYEEITKTQLKFPNVLKDQKAKNLISQLLSKQPEARLGESYKDLKANPYFDDLDFNKLLNKELKAPYRPPKSRLISDKEIERKFQQGKSVVSQIKSEQDAQKIQYGKEQAKDPNWDENF